MYLPNYRACTELAAALAVRSPEVSTRRPNAPLAFAGNCRYAGAHLNSGARAAPPLGKTRHGEGKV
jgi:hypothetical protein